MEKKLKHLEFIQNAILRMSTLSFQLKGWCITLVTAMTILASDNKDHKYIFLVYMIIPIFCILDAFYLAKERDYRALYDEVRKNNEDEIDFNMKPDAPIVNNFTKTIFSISIWPLYAILAIVTFLILII